MNQTTSTIPEPYRVFVYGTLKRGFSNHEYFCHGVATIEEAVMRGRLYALNARIPALEIPSDDILAVGTHDYQLDAMTLTNEKITRASISSSADGGQWRMIRGEVLTFSESERLARLDRLEGFRPQGASLYQRVLAPVTLVSGRVLTVWVYVKGDLRHSHLTPVESDIWEDHLTRHR